MQRVLTLSILALAIPALAIPALTIPALAAAAEPDTAARAILDSNLPVLADPQWVEKPTASVMTKAYPDRALIRGRQGEAQLLCRVRLDGTVSDCGVLSESYDGRYQFGRGALSVTPHFRLTPKTIEGMPVTAPPLLSRSSSNGAILNGRRNIAA